MFKRVILKKILGFSDWNQSYKFKKVPGIKKKIELSQIPFDYVPLKSQRICTFLKVKRN